MQLFSLYNKNFLYEWEYGRSKGNKENRGNGEMGEIGEMREI